MPLRLMLCAFILLALGGCQNPSRIQAASSHSAAVPGLHHLQRRMGGRPDLRDPWRSPLRALRPEIYETMSVACASPSGIAPVVHEPLPGGLGS